MLHKLHYYWLLLLLDGLKKKAYKLKSRAPYIPIRTGVLCNKIIQITAFLCIMAVLTIIFCLQNPKIFIACQFDRHVNFWIFKTKNYFQKIFGQSQSGHITSIHLTGDVSTMCFILYLRGITV